MFPLLEKLIIGRWPLVTFFRGLCTTWNVCVFEAAFIRTQPSRFLLVVLMCIQPSSSPKLASMVSDEAPKISTEQRETSTEQPEESLTGQQMVASTEAALEHDVESDSESQSCDSGDCKTASDNSVKVVAAAALAGISYDFAQSTITKICLGSLENNAHYFLKGYG
jgi:hypothetical protein